MADISATENVPGGKKRQKQVVRHEVFANQVIQICINIRNARAEALKRQAAILKETFDQIKEAVDCNPSITLEGICGECGHRRSREPYFYDFAYVPVKNLVKTDSNYGTGRARFLVNVYKRMWTNPTVIFSKALKRTVHVGLKAKMMKKETTRMNWYVQQRLSGVQRNGFRLGKKAGEETCPCDRHRCLYPSNAVQRLADMQGMFGNVPQIRVVLAQNGIDRCSKVATNRNHKTWLSQQQHFTDQEKRFSKLPVIQKMDKKGHPWHCLPNNCTSDLLMLRQLQVHFKYVSKVVRHIYLLMELDRRLCEIDEALILSNYKLLEALAETHKSFEDSVANALGPETEKIIPVEDQLPFLPYYKPYMDAIKEKPVCACACCQVLKYRKSVRQVWMKEPRKRPAGLRPQKQNHPTIHVGGPDRIGEDWNPPWNHLWQDLYDHYANAFTDKNQLVEGFYLCDACNEALKGGGAHAPQAIFNNMYVDHVPKELAILNTFEVICIQRAKCFQTVTRLGSVGKGAPVSDRLKTSKGQILYYPLPLEETIRQLEEAAGEAPGMHIIINSLATRNRRIWSRIIDLGKVKAALLWLKQNNWLYANVDSDVWMKSVATFLADPNLEIEDETQDDDVPEDVARVCEDLAVRGALLKPMLKKVKEGGDAIPEEDSEARTLLEPCTIHSLESRLPKDAHLKVYQMQRIEGEKLKNKYQHIDLASFPVLYPRGQFGEDHARTISVSSAEFVKNRLMHKDYRFRYDHQYIFSRLWDQELRQVAQGVNQTLRNRKRYNDVNVKDFLDMADKFDDQLEYNVSMIFQQLRGSPQYWRNVRNELLCMLRELGPPTWFVTLSANEYNWESMESMLKTMNAHLPNVDNMRTSALCALDPVMAQEHFHHRFASFFNEVILYHKDGQGGPLGLYQQRGAPHYHILLWVNGAPKKGKDSDEKVAKFIQQHATCRMPDPETEPLLHHNVKTYQSHGCNNYCMRRFRSGKGKGVKAVCRFGFPRPIRKKILFRDVLRSIALRSRGTLKKQFYELRRQPHERRINDYNETVSLLWSGNIDVQYNGDEAAGFKSSVFQHSNTDFQHTCNTVNMYIGEETAALASYVCGYVTKRESTHTDLWQEIDENKPIHHQLYAYSFQKLKNRECGIIEAIDRLRSQCLYQKTRRTIYINARKASERTVCLRPYAELRQIAEHNAESTDKYAQNWIDDYYPNRPRLLEDWCYYNVRKYYEKVNDPKKELRFLNSSVANDSRFFILT